MIRKYAEFEGFQVEEAADGMIAVEMCSRTLYDLVVMDIESFTRREKMLQLREELLAVEEDRVMGRKDYSIDELDGFLDDILNEG